MRREILEILQNEYAERRVRNDQILMDRQAEVSRVCPRIGELIAQRQELIYTSLRQAIRGDTKTNVPEKMRAIQAEIAEQLLKNGFAADYLEPVYRCPICKDTGYVGDTVREMCRCMQAELNRRLYAGIGLDAGEDQSFERFDLNLFPDTVIQNLGCSQRWMMKDIRAIAEGWSRRWPEAEFNGGILFSGASGLGKTFLMHCMARVMVERNLNVLVISAYQAQEIMRRAYFRGEDPEMEALMHSDVLFLDDLGSEPLMQNVTIPQMFQLFNERMRMNRAVVVSTNLSPSDLRERYTERITSRILDSRRMKVIEMRGQDVRRMRSGNG